MPHLQCSKAFEVPEKYYVGFWEEERVGGHDAAKNVFVDHSIILDKNVARAYATTRQKVLITKRSVTNPMLLQLLWRLSTHREIKCTALAVQLIVLASFNATVNSSVFRIVDKYGWYERQLLPSEQIP